jgi:hypothetical protein
LTKDTCAIGGHAVLHSVVWGYVYWGARFVFCNCPGKTPQFRRWNCGEPCDRPSLPAWAGGHKRSRSNRPSFAKFGVWDDLGDSFQGSGPSIWDEDL